jgi:ankyrin repeat protein
MKKLLLGSFFLLVLAIIALPVYDMATMDIDELIFCSADEGGIKIPSGVCEYYMVNYRINTDDIAQLSNGAGLDAILNLDTPKKYEIAKTFISRGLNVNGINHYNDKDITPLHAAVLYNDVERASFLIEQGADLSIRSSRYGMTALELANQLHQDQSDESRIEIIDLLSPRS